MTYVLAAVAIGCAVTVVLGFWSPLGKLLNIESLKVPLLEGWLGPVFAPSEPLVESRAAESGTTWEWILIFASVSVAFLGWYVARAFYKDAKSTVPAKLQASFPRLHRVVYNKYYVDEFYQATVIRGVTLLSRACSVFDQVVIDGAVNGVATVGRFICNIEGAIDVYLVDGAVNFFADGVLRIGNRLRRIQSGRIQQYLYAAVAGALAVIGISYLIH
jgi:NADH-quinone oxidoreductase subunit L